MNKVLKSTHKGMWFWDDKRIVAIRNNRFYGPMSDALELDFLKDKGSCDEKMLRKERFGERTDFVLLMENEI